MKHGRIVFLDIDGVLNGAEWTHREEAGATWTGSRITQEPARVLHFLLQQTSANVVLISAWRNWVNSGSMTPAGFGNMLKSHGITVKIVDALPAKSPDMNHAKDRAVKLLQWLENNECRSYVVLEDLDLTPFGVQNQIKTDPRIGLIEKHIDQAIRMFERQERHFTRDVLMM